MTAGDFLEDLEHAQKTAATIALSGKNVLLTGLRHGAIGETAAALFTKLGANVVGAGRSKAELDQCADFLASHGITLVGLIESDFASAGAGANLGREVLEKHPPIDVLLNIAGFTPEARMFAEGSDQADEELLRINYLNPRALTRCIVPGMIRRKSGTIIFFSSIHGISASPGFITYGESKAAVERLALGIAREVAPNSVNVFTVRPGWVKVDRHAADKVALAESELPRGKMATREEISILLARLCAPGNEVLSGTVLDPSLLQLGAIA